MDSYIKEITCAVVEMSLNSGMLASDIICQAKQIINDENTKELKED